MWAVMEGGKGRRIIAGRERFSTNKRGYPFSCYNYKVTGTG